MIGWVIQHSFPWLDSPCGYKKPIIGLYICHIFRCSSNGQATPSAIKSLASVVYILVWWCFINIVERGESVALLVARRTNDRKVVGSRPTKVVCITVLTGNHSGWTVHCGRPPLLLPSCRKLEFRLWALMDSDLTWVNGKSGRQSWYYADAFQRSIISEAIYHLSFFLWSVTELRQVCLVFSLSI